MLVPANELQYVIHFKALSKEEASRISNIESNVALLVSYFDFTKFRLKDAVLLSKDKS